MSVTTPPDDLVDDGSDHGHAVPEPPSEPVRPPEEGWGWHLRQIVTWLLAVLLLVQVFGTWVFHDPGHFGVGFYVLRWQHTGWRFFDAAFVALALTHGGLGLHHLVASRCRSEGARMAAAIVIGVVLASIGLLAVSTILTFDLTP